MFNVARRRKEKELTRPSHMIHFFVSFHIFPGFIIRFFFRIFRRQVFFLRFREVLRFPNRYEPILPFPSVQRYDFNRK